MVVGMTLLTLRAIIVPIGNDSVEKNSNKRNRYDYGKKVVNSDEDRRR